MFQALQQLEILPGNPSPPGASALEGGGVNFSVFSKYCDAVDLVLFDANDSSRETARVRLTERTGHTWHIGIRGLETGQRYGFRASGPWVPESGHLFNPAKLLLDPYARQVDSPSAAHPSMLGWEGSDLNRTDSGAFAPKGVVNLPAHFDWENDAAPRISFEDSVIYELHVRGFTRRLDSVPEELRGTYAGLAHSASIDYLKHLGITTVQLMPVHHHLDDDFLIERGLVNYWGYNSIGFFAPETSYAAWEDPVLEFKWMVKSLHAAGIEVILDVVYNHTGEAGPQGPVCHFRGLHNRGYYRTRQKHPEQYQDFTGCGNSLNIGYPQSLQLVIDSLRYWVEEMHVDGFRFDLAVTLGREPTSFNPHSAFFKAIQSDPMLSRIKLIAEPWDLGRGGYQLGNFPDNWAELNGKFRDCLRQFWKGDGKVLGDFAYRITGSEDIFHHNGRSPGASVNFVTSHDGFTMNDLVSYAKKHNEANGEKNRDGDSHNLSSNHGAERPTKDPKIEALRLRQCRNFFATTLLSQGAPFILAGDEIGRTQGGNNNAYCLDNEISWIDWKLGEHYSDLHEFVRRMIEFRSQHPVLRKHRYFSGQPIDGSPAADMAWFDPNAALISNDYWHADQPGAFSVVINRKAADQQSNDSPIVRSDSLLLIFNAVPKSAKFRLPGASDIAWSLAIDTAESPFFFDAENDLVRSGRPVTLTNRSLQVWILREGDFAHDQDPPEES